MRVREGRRREVGVETWQGGVRRGGKEERRRPGWRRSRNQFGVGIRHVRAA